MVDLEYFEFVKKELIPYVEDQASLKLDGHLVNDLFLDSIALLSLCTAIENHYKIFLPDDYAHPPETIRDILVLIDQALREQVKV